MTSETSKLTAVQKSGYALGIHGIMYFWYATNLYLLYFYTDIVGLTPAQTGTVFMLSLIWDGITDPVICQYWNNPNELMKNSSNG